MYAEENQQCLYYGWKVLGGSMTVFSWCAGMQILAHSSKTSERNYHWTGWLEALWTEWLKPCDMCWCNAGKWSCLGKRIFIVVHLATGSPYHVSHIFVNWFNWFISLYWIDRSDLLIQVIREDSRWNDWLVNLLMWSQLVDVYLIFMSLSFHDKLMFCMLGVETFFLESIF